MRHLQSPLVADTRVAVELLGIADRVSAEERVIGLLRLFFTATGLPSRYFGNVTTMSNEV